MPLNTERGSLLVFVPFLSASQSFSCILNRMVTTCGQLTTTPPRTQGSQDAISADRKQLGCGTLISHAWSDNSDQSNDSDHAEHPQPVLHTLPYHNRAWSLLQELPIPYLSIAASPFLGMFMGAGIIRHAFVHRLHVICHRLRVISTACCSTIWLFMLACSVSMGLHGSIGGRHLRHGVLHQCLHLLHLRASAPSAISCSSCPCRNLALLYARHQRLRGCGLVLLNDAPVVPNAAASAISARTFRFNFMSAPLRGCLRARQWPTSQ